VEEEERRGGGRAGGGRRRGRRGRRKFYWVPLYVAPFGAVQKNHPDFDFGCFFVECFFFFVLSVAPFADVV